MRSITSALIAAVVLASPGRISAQSTTGTIRGHVSDAQGLVLPGVTVSVTSPNLQGSRVAVSSENGDYSLTLLPSGPYTLTFELSGFQRQQRTVSLAPTQDLPIDIALGPAAISEAVEVVGRAADVLTQTAQVATNFTQELMATLPTTRDINAVMLLAPAVHPTGPAGAYSIAGAMSFESLFMVNGVTVNENLRGQPYDLYIEDAIQETTVATAGISAEYGRFSGGVVNVVTKSGGNRFSGSFRDTLLNDHWRTLTPFEDRAIAAGGIDTRVKKTIPTYEYTVGGPIAKDRLWFFTAGRLQTQESGRQLVQTLVPYTFRQQERRFEFKGTYSVKSNHSVQAAYTKINQSQFNNTFNQAVSMDLNSLEDRQVPQNLFTIHYNGILTQTLSLEGRLSARHQSFVGSGAKSTDLIAGTLLLDRQRGNLRYWSATFCGVCDPEKRDNDDAYVKGTYFLSKKGVGTHTMAFGYDRFNDKRFANNHQSGSDYRIFGTTSLIAGTGASAVIYPQFLGDGTTLIRWQPIFVSSLGTSFQTHSIFFNDNWRVGGRLTANLGLRFDRNHGENGSGRLVAKDSAWSPRLGVIWDPTGTQTWSITGSFAKYVDAISTSIGDVGSAGGNFDQYDFVYAGPSINGNPSGPLVPTDVALRQLYDWFNANGGASRPLSGTPIVSGLSPQIVGSLSSPHVLEYAAGASRQVGGRMALRGDFVYRDYRNFYVQRDDTSTGVVIDSRPGAPASVRGRVYDLAVVENTDLLKRRYAGLTTQAQYRFGTRFDVGANYTLSRLWGNVDGETVNGGPSASDILTYPEYKQEAWYYPEGDLSGDQRHRARLWANYGIRWVSGLTLSLLEDIGSGVPYGAASGTGVDPRLYVANPGYLTPPSGQNTTYYFTARDAFRTEGPRRTDVAANYVYRLRRAANLELFGQLQVLNLFNQFQLCGCGATVFLNGGAIRQERIDQTVLTPVTTARLQPFNPFTTTPAQGVNWDYGTNFGKALNRFAYSSPRALRLSFGVRF